MFNDKQGIIATGVALVTFAASAATNSPPAQLDEWSRETPRLVNISLTNFHVNPDALHLEARHPILLRIANDSGMAHDLTAPEFFRAAAMRPVDAARIVGGKIALAPHQNVVISMIPSAGRYSMKCSRTLHRMLGMSGTIVVDS